MRAVAKSHAASKPRVLTYSNVPPSSVPRPPSTPVTPKPRAASSQAAPFTPGALNSREALGHEYAHYEEDLPRRPAASRMPPPLRRLPEAKSSSRPPARGARPSAKDASQPPAAGGEGKMLFPGRLKGEVAEYDEESGSALISCPQIKSLFQDQVTADWRDLEQASSAVDIGSWVSFLVQLGPGGKPQAKELKLESPEDDEEREAPARPPKKRKLAGRTPMEQGDEPGERFVGVIKSFHEGIGLGKIGRKASRSGFGADVSVDADEFAGFAVGDTVSFAVALDPELGTPKATALEAA